MKKIPNPHDHYFRSAMSDHRVAREFFEYHLPKHILRVAELNSLRLEKSSFIDEHLQAAMADILYTVNLNDQPGYFYVVVEHQRKPEKLMPYRLLRYLLRIMEQHLKKKGHQGILPLVVPLVFYNGQKRYPYSTDIFTLFGNQEAMAREVLLKPFTLIDVTQIPDEALKQMRWAGIMEFVQKHIFTRDFLSAIEELLPLLKYLEKHGAEDYLLSTVNYFLQSDLENPVRIAKLLGERLSSQMGEEIMTLAERLEQKGFERGKALAERLEQKGFEKGKALAERLAQKGRAEEKRLIACQMLREKVDPSFVAKVTGLSLETVQTLNVESD